MPSGAMSADEFLKKMGVRNGLSGLDYTGSRLLEDGQYRVIDFAVEYGVEIYILKFFRKNPVIRVSQRALIPA